MNRLDVLTSAPEESRHDAHALTGIPWPELVQSVRKSMRSIVGPSNDLEDLTQSALEQLLRGVERFEGRADLSTFAYRVCVHVAMNHWRWWKRWLRQFDLGTDAGANAMDASPELSAVTMERARVRRLHDLLAKITPTRRIVVTLIDLEELPALQVAEILDCPEATVRSRLRRGRIELEKLVLADPFFREELGSP